MGSQVSITTSECIGDAKFSLVVKKAFSSDSNFTQALQKCKDFDANLASIRSTAEFNVVKDFLKVQTFTQSEGVWIGVREKSGFSGSHKCITDAFEFTDGSLNESFIDGGSCGAFPWGNRTFSRGQQPDDSGDCVRMATKVSEGEDEFQLDDFTCSNLLPFLCRLDCDDVIPSFSPTAAPILATFNPDEKRDKTTIIAAFAGVLVLLLGAMVPVTIGLLKRGKRMKEIQQNVELLKSNPMEYFAREFATSTLPNAKQEM